MTVGNNLSFSSITLRHLARPEGKDIAIPFFSVDGPLSGTATWTYSGQEPITSGGKTVKCSVYTLASLRTDQPLGAGLKAALDTGVGTKMWLDASGSILKLVKSTGNIVVVRE